MSKYNHKIGPRGHPNLPRQDREGWAERCTPCRYYDHSRCKVPSGLPCECPCEHSPRPESGPFGIREWDALASARLVYQALALSEAEPIVVLTGLEAYWAAVERGGPA